MQSFCNYKDNIAIEKGDEAITYGELHKRTDAVANRIIKKGIKKETFIGVILDDRKEFIFAMIGILKAGCVFIPLEPGYPDNRLKTMIQTTDTAWIIIDKTNSQRTFAIESTIGFIHIEDAAVDKNGERGCEQIETKYLPGDKLYIYFTSGTTGNPKAVIGRNGSLLHFINWEIAEFSIDETFRCSQFTNPGFDVYLRDVLMPLCAGAVVCIPGNVGISSDQYIYWLDTRDINLIHCVPSLFRVFNTPDLEKGNFKTLKYLLFAGEKIIPRELKNWYDIFGERIQLVNLYGPTETTLAKVFYRISKPDTDREIMPIGKHIDGTRLIILNENMNICEKLVTGEIYIRTPFRSFGYYKDPDLNREKFIPNPFSNDPADILYKTGDLGRLLPDGNIELSGRIDRQVKMRGVRIELEGIENLLIKHPSIKEAVVIKKVSGINEFLYSCITRSRKSSEEADLLIQHLKKYLAENLPEVMIPTNIIILEEIPRKVNGKVDYDKISALDENSPNEYTPPGNKNEMKLAKLWSEILNIEKPDINKNFFELGGNSLNVMSLIAKIHREFNVKISMEEMFNHPTIKKQAGIIMEAKKDKYSPIEAAEKKQYYELSSAQKRMYLLQQMDLESTAYNISQILTLDGELKREILEKTLKKLIKRHESLRTSFQSIHHQPVQKVHEAKEFDRFAIEYYQAQVEKKNRSISSLQGIIDIFIRSFDLSQAPLMRIGLIKREKRNHVLMVNMHHITSDGVSMSILLNEFMALYGGEKLPELRIHYKDYSEWQNSEEEIEKVKNHEEYWLKQFKGDIPTLNMLTDYEIPKNLSFEGDKIYFLLDKELNDQLYKFTKETDTTLYMILLAVFYILLTKYTEQQDIVVGTAVAGRGHSDLQSIVGMFVNTLAMRNYPSENKTFREFVQEVKENTINAYENQDYQFDELVMKLGIQREYGRNPIFNTHFIFHNEIEQFIEIPGLKLTSYKNTEQFYKFDLSLNAFKSDDTIAITLRYLTDLFKPSTAERLIEHYVEILKQVLENQAIALKDIKLHYALSTGKSYLSREEALEFEL
jgi:amino acid adenylation domain-containing protein